MAKAKTNPFTVVPDPKAADVADDQDDDDLDPSDPLDLEVAAASGDRLTLLYAERALVAKVAKRAGARDLAALTRRLELIADRITDLEAQQKGDELDDAGSTPDEEYDGS